MSPRAGLITLAGAAFVYVTAETLPAGLHVRPGTVGLLVSAYAALAAAGLLLTRTARRAFPADGTSPAAARPPPPGDDRRGEARPSHPGRLPAGG